MIKFERRSKIATKAAVARTPLAKDVRRAIRFNMMGQMIPPNDAP